MQALFYNFAKRRNSTLTPSIPDGTKIDIEIKEESDVLRPTVLLRSISRPGYNYVNVPALGRYYYITNETWKNGIWELTCQYDAMATYKASIGITDHYVIRSSADYDGEIYDNLYPSKANVSQEVVTDTQLLWDDLRENTGYYIIGLIGKWFENVDPQIGALTYVAMEPMVFRSFMNKMFSDEINWLVPAGQEIGISDSLAKMIFDPFQYIKSVRWVPSIRNNNIQEMQQILRIGFWYIEIPCYPLSNYPFFVINRNINVPKHPKSTERGNYLNTSRFSRYVLTLPLFGDVAIDANDLSGCAKVNITYILDLISGEASCRIEGSGQGVTLRNIKVLYGTYGVDIPLAQAMNVLSQVAQPVTSLIGGSISGNPAVISDSILSFTDILSPPMSYIGNYSGFMQVYNALISIEGIFHDIADEDNSCNGRPLCKIRKPRDIPGYIQVEHCEVSNTRILPEEMAEIKAYMEGGFFYE